jgi:alkanesulfonate monooxygenase SsuD/methylene tetrahydromethanopterin reductase-like flavin-dependent oxidoreductase (luciferase family)
MRVGIGLPTAIPGAPASLVGEWAASSERAGFRSLGVIDRLVYDNLEPLLALAAAAERTEAIELLSTVLTVGYRRNPVVLAKQIATLDELAGGRLSVGIGLGGWPEDYAASDVEQAGLGRLFEEILGTMRAAWLGRIAGASGPMRAVAPGRPRLLIGGLVAPAYARAAAWGEGWVAPSFGLQALTDGIAGVRGAWEEAGREDRPRIVVERYFCLGQAAREIANQYLLHYYGPTYLPAVLADTLTDVRGLRVELDRLAEVGCDDVVLLPCRGDLDQIVLLAEALNLSPNGDTAHA